MKTAFMLMAQFDGKAVVQLEDICKEFFNMSKAVALTKAKHATLPVPAYRASDSNKAPWLVNISDLAEHLDKMRDEVKRAQDMIAA